MKQKSKTEKTKQHVPAVNFHLLQACNMRCRHCFVANLHTTYLSLEEACEIVRMLPQVGCEKINFAGGEPMLYPRLDRLIREAKENGMTTSIVTNGTKITDVWLDTVSGYLDWIALSIDSTNSDTHRLSGRYTEGCPLTTDRYLEMCCAIKHHGIRLKINTVVTRYNCDEDMAWFIREAAPERWKIMQALAIEGQNDRNVGLFEVTDGQFDAYVKRNESVNDIRVVPESNDLMTGSYMMIDPTGRFFDNTKSSYTYSRPILQVGISSALQDVKINPEKFDMRGGRYEW